VIEAAAYRGYFSHRRSAERPQTFRHAIAYLFFDVERAEQVLGGRLVEGLYGLRFCEEDYLPGPGPLAGRVRRRLEELTGVAAPGPVYMLAGVRSFGRCYNPIALFYCHDRSGAPLGVVAEVTNTPWRQRETYALLHGSDGEAEKRLFVSPFLDLDERYRWRASPPGERISVVVENLKGGKRTFMATLVLERVTLSRALLRNPSFRYHHSPRRTLALIYGHAAVIRALGVRWRNNERAGAAAVA